MFDARSPMVDGCTADATGRVPTKLAATLITWHPNNRKSAIDTRQSFRAFGATDPGRRAVNEDRVLCRPERGLFAVVDGVGGETAGEVAAELALAVLVRSLEASAGPAGERLTRAILAANNAIFDASRTAPSLGGMACVLTVALVEDGRVTVAHVGDTRLYEVRAHSIRKITRDHALVGQMEEAGLLSEAEAMAHPQRNEILRDVGSAPHAPGDAGFVDLYHLPMDDAGALLLCSDGLTDLVPQAAIHDALLAHAGRPDEAVHALIDRACDAGGHDNITALVVEGPQFQDAVHRARPSLNVTRPDEPMPHQLRVDAREWDAVQRRMQERRWLLAAAAILLLGLALVFHAKTRDFADSQRLLDEHAIVNLNDLAGSDALLPAFASIYPDPRDQQLAAQHTFRTMQRLRDEHLVPWWTLPNVGRLNTATFDVPAREVASGGSAFMQRLSQAEEAESVDLVGSTTAFQRLKPQLVVRSPDRYRWVFWGLAGVFLLAFFGLHAFWFRRRFAGDPLLLPLVFLLTGLALLLMFSLPDPLRDWMRAMGFVGGVVAGCVLIGIVSQIDFQQAFWRKRAGWWLGMGLCTAAVLYAFGTGPTGSNARVNLAVPVLGSVQPVGLIKLCLVLFLAGYFARHWAYLRQLHQRDGMPRWMQRLRLPRVWDWLPVAAGVAASLLGFYLLHDMGPALVMGCTFLGLYGIARQRWLAVAVGALVLVGGFWLAYQTGAVPVVAGRVAMMLSPWENFVLGGEHLAHAHWAMAAGGITGQGLGLGHPQYIPAAHTDLVLPALGEELGLLGLLVVLALYALLLARSLRIALRAGGMFSLFLGLGIALLMLFQIVLIAGGSLGLIPLSGVVSPFLSYGKSSMAVNCVLVGILFSLSARPKIEIQTETQAQHFARPVRVLLVFAVGLLGVLAAKCVYIQAVAADAWSVRPALVVRGDGERAFAYNPRIYDARRHLVRGTIYDRNGVPLATSRWDEVEQFADVYADAGIQVDSLKRPSTRYYPFGAHTFYLLGDIRSRVKWGAPNSLYAEHAFLSHLRGYDNDPTPVEARRTRSGPAEPVVRYNYAELLPLVRHGPDADASQALLARERDLQLTIDVRLQQRVGQILEAQIGDSLTASVIVLDAATGDVLASVTSPLPEKVYTHPEEAHQNPSLFDRGFGRGAKPPGSTFKLVTAMAALRRTPDAAGWIYPVRSWDRYARRGEPTGDVTLARAIISSSNVYFAALAHELVGAEMLLQTMHAFGFYVGSPDLSDAEQRRLLEEPDNLRQAGFGQGPVIGSPLQVALVTATIANDGLLPKVRWVCAPDAAPTPGRRILSPRHARLLAGYMRRVVTDEEGTGHVLHDAAVPIAGKSGTAEERERVLVDGTPEIITVNHAWFTGFAPYRDPLLAINEQRRIAIAVLVEEGGTGGRVAAPVAGAVAEAAAALGVIERGGMGD